MDWRGKRYTIRLSENDKDIFNYLEGSNKKNKNELIKGLLRSALEQKEVEKEDLILAELKTLQKEQRQFYEKVMIKLNNDLVSKVEEKVEVSKKIEENDSEISQAIDNSIDYMLSGFGEF